MVTKDRQDLGEPEASEAESKREPWRDFEVPPLLFSLPLRERERIGMIGVLVLDCIF